MGWPAWVIPTLLRVVRCESEGYAVQNYSGGPYYGLLQIGGFWFPHFGYAFESWPDPYVNLRVGYLIWLSHGQTFSAWECG